MFRMLILATFAAGVFPATAAPLLFDERVRAQEAIERVYYEHRIWPKENSQPKPSFEDMVPATMIASKVRDYLAKSAALEQVWKRPLQPEQLQAELDRLARETRDPGMLEELFTALDNDPRLIAECLARPSLAARLVHNWYAGDHRFHQTERELAETALRRADPEALAAYPEGTYRNLVYRLQSASDSVLPRGPSKEREISLDEEAFQRLLARTPTGGKLALRETEEGFLVFKARGASSTSLEVELLAFGKRPFDLWWDEIAKTLSADEPGSEGFRYRLPSVQSFRATGSGDGSWIESSLDWSGVPEARYGHTAVWTGTEMVVFGGREDNCWTLFQSGGRYNPATDSWVPTFTGAFTPPPMAFHSAVWTGKEMIVFGYTWPSLGRGSGGAYDPVADRWRPISSTDSPSPQRYFPSTLWTGNEMIVWGGYGYPNWTEFNTGARYNPSTDRWRPISTGKNCPSRRRDNTAVWTGKEMIIFGVETLTSTILI